MRFLKNNVILKVKFKLIRLKKVNFLLLKINVFNKI